MAGAAETQSLLDESVHRGGRPTRSPLGDPEHLCHRIIVLVFMCFLGFGSYFCYDNPAALQKQVIKDMRLNTSGFMQLYAWYSWPNVFLCFVGGFLLDRVFGIRLGTIIFSLFVCGGQVIFALGALVDRVWLMELGRFVFGIGGESLAVAQNTYAVNWFKGKELNLVFGLQLSMARVGSTVNMNIMGWVYKQVKTTLGHAGPTTLGTALMIGCSSSRSSTSRPRSIVYILSAPASPVLGLLVDKTGKNITWVLCAVVTTLLAHMMLAFTFWNPWIAMVILGMSYSLLACALWPMVAFVVPEHQLGTAYGFMQSIQNLGLALISMAAGVIVDRRGYLFLEVFFCFCVCVALVAVVMLYFVDFLRGGELNISASSRAKQQKATSVESE
ncbi:major facilitator superfamily domain-containing protein 1 isoform X3 [Electrophorus electricus]|uniref:major facilitator superfamily domain-containing protein 1 isoform X3 n=1 Tax=Electrophorus electricus TaxID=8005 RepID=UPI0015D0C101|nr:major facilitator superfamily domain-containing protein 1 isoform X3 [Electrophorus electricus]